MSEQLDYLVVYGDSYSDIHQGTKRTNGPVWSEHLSQDWNTKLISFAKSGATFCKNNKENGSWLSKQISERHKIDENSNTVRVIFLGITDIIENKGELKKTNEWIKCIKDQIRFFYSSDPGSKVIIMGVPALEFSPYAAKHPSEDLKQNIIDFNVALEEQVAEWQEEISDKIEFFDTYLVFSDIFGDPSVASIENVEDAYWDKCQGQCQDDIDSYLWYDSLHVTGSGHKAIAETLKSKEYFNIKSIEEFNNSSFIDERIPNISLESTKYMSLFIFGCILLFFIYLFRHHRILVSFKQKIQSKFYSRKNNTDYTLV